MSGYGQSEALADEARPVRFAARARAWLRKPTVRRAGYRVALVALIAIGMYFRSRRYWIDPLGLWVDEAQWGLRLFGRPLTQLEFRPIGYMALTKLIVTLYSDERSLRLLSYGAGIASLLITVDLAKHLFESRWVRVLCLAVVAFNPLLIDMAREFKPYALEFCVHLGLIWLFVRWRTSGARAWLAALLVCAALAFPFAYNVVFLLPGLFLLVGYRCLRAKRYRALFAAVAAATAALVLMGVIYVSALKSTTEDSDGSVQFWGKKYDVFFLPNAQQKHHGLARLVWVAHKYGDLAAFPGSHGNRALTDKVALTDATRKLGELSAGAWLALHAVGLLALLVYRREQLLLLGGPLLMSALFNALGLWPFGAFRGNVFLLAYVILIPMIGLDVLLAARLALARLAGALGSACLLIANLSAGFEPHEHKHFFSTQTEMTSLVLRMAELRAQRPGGPEQHKTLVLLDAYTCAPFVFEVQHNDTARRKFGSFLSQDLNVQCLGSAPAIIKILRHHRGERFFAVVSDDRQMEAFASILGRQSKIIDHEQIRDSQDLYFATVR